MGTSGLPLSVYVPRPTYASQIAITLRRRAGCWAAHGMAGSLQDGTNRADESTRHVTMELFGRRSLHKPGTNTEPRAGPAWSVGLRVPVGGHGDRRTKNEDRVRHGTRILLHAIYSKDARANHQSLVANISQIRHHQVTGYVSTNQRNTGIMAFIGRTSHLCIRSIVPNSMLTPSK